jgi:DNA-directed RNA polymerase subunit RPC12/RpoP
MKIHKEKDLVKCPNCGSKHPESKFKPSFRYETLIECPDCIKKVRPNNRAVIDMRGK